MHHEPREHHALLRAESTYALLYNIIIRYVHVVLRMGCNEKTTPESSGSFSSITDQLHMVISLPRLTGTVGEQVIW